MGRIDERLQLLFAEGWLGAATRAPAVVRINLDPVGSPPRLLAGDTDHIRDTTGFLGPLRRATNIGPQTARRGTIRPGCHDGPGCHKQPRAGNEPVSDRVLQGNVRVISPFS